MTDEGGGGGWVAKNILKETFWKKGLCVWYAANTQTWRTVTLQKQYGEIELEIRSELRNYFFCGRWQQGISDLLVHSSCFLKEKNLFLFRGCKKYNKSLCLLVERLFWLLLTRHWLAGLPGSSLKLGPGRPASQWLVNNSQNRRSTYAQAQAFIL